ncbi:MAG: fatty acid cis/trans isomerase [Rhodoferax sp.]|nr:fatty acid cis/trans isomerase [Rhodoferax sp.]
MNNGRTGSIPVSGTSHFCVKSLSYCDAKDVVRFMRLPALVLLLSVVAGCATLVSDTLDSRFGLAEPTRYDSPRPPEANAPSYTRDVKPIFDKRCVVCHGCYDAPCQLNLGSWQGIARGLTKASVYGDLRVHQAPLTRLGIDAQQASQWRRLGFGSVLNERDETAENQVVASVLWRSLTLKQNNPLPTTPVLSEAKFDFSLSRANTCPQLDEFDAHAVNQPLAGMPYGFPGLKAHESEVIRQWLQAGSPDDTVPELPTKVLQQVAAWEQLLNSPSRKHQLVARYLFEHLFLGHLKFENDGQGHVFRLVRSTTPPGKPVHLIATRRPFDHPGNERPFYRLVRDRETLLAKTYMPYVLSPARMARWRQWFHEVPFDVDTLPGYDAEVAANTFKTFAAIPLRSRYRFLLDDAGYFVSNFIKGPVCRGQTALDVINDRFWVFFVDPDLGANDDASQLVAREAEELRMPASEGSNASVFAWRAIAAAEDRILAAKTQHMDKVFGGGRAPININFVWDGDQHNPNAALTIFRHFDSATVERGLIGEPPKTAWVIGYPLLERIFYLLAAGFDVYGNTAHQLQTRLAMDFLRMEGESHFLMLLPKADRSAVRDSWYRGASDEVKSRVLGGIYRFDAESGIKYPPGTASQQHLFALLRRRLLPVLDMRHEINAKTEASAQIGQALSDLAKVRGRSLQWLPEVSVLRIEAEPRAEGAAANARYVSLLRNTAHQNVSTLFRESSTLVPDENTLTVANGFIGAYPNALLQVNADQLSALVQAIASLRSESDYRAFADRFAIRRTDPDFWFASDALMTAYQRWAPEDAALLDLARFENR